MWQGEWIAVLLRCYAREVTRSQNTTTRRDHARFCDKRRCGNLQKLLDVKKSISLTEVCFAVSMRVVVGAGDGDEESVERDDAREMKKRRLGECQLGELGRENAWKKGVVVKTGAGGNATSSKPSLRSLTKGCVQSERFLRKLATQELGGGIPNTPSGRAGCVSKQRLFGGPSLNPLALDLGQWPSLRTPRLHLIHKVPG
jgi:hypothetical protein